MTAKSMKSLLIFTAAITLFACGGGPYADYSQSELQDAYSDCENRDSMSPGAAITCDNIRRECDSRAKEKGRKVCF
ncbi:MAG: hypothetical protein MI867_13000 [Pseudomonadales bacterium]|nr:hypothetical protein [Pseudomonadales bacterium]